MAGCSTTDLVTDASRAAANGCNGVCELRANPRARLLLVVACAVSAVLLAHYPMVFSGLRLVQADPMDTRLNNYFLEHAHRHLTGTSGDGSIWSPAFFHPLENATAYGDVLWSLWPAYGIWRFMGMAPDTAFQLWMMCATLLNCVIFYVFLGACFSLSGLPACAGALLFAVGSSRICQMGHQQLISHFYVVLALIAVCKLLHAPPAPDCDDLPGRDRARTRTWMALFFGACVAQCYAGFYNAFFLAVILISAFALSLLLPDLRWRTTGFVKIHPGPVLAFALPAALMLLPLYVHYDRAKDAVGTRAWHEVTPMLPRPQSWFCMPPGSLLYARMGRLGLFRALPMRNEHHLGTGFLTPIVAALGLWKRRRRSGVRLVVIAAMTMVCGVTIWPGAHSAWWFIYRCMPGAQAVRAVARIGIFLLVPAGLGLALFLEGRSPRTRPWLLLIAMLCILEQAQALATYSKAYSRACVASIVGAIDRDCQAFFVSAEGGASGNEPEIHTEVRTHVDAMWAQMQTGIPTVNGYSGHYPRDYGRLQRLVVRDAADVREIESALQSWADRWRLDRDSICWVKLKATP